MSTTRGIRKMARESLMKSVNEKRQRDAMARQAQTVTVQDGDGNDYELAGCECDNTHEQNQTVCRWCWEQGVRWQPKEEQP